MKKVSVLAAAAAVALGMTATSCGDSKTNVSLKNDVDSVSYAIGVNIGTGIHNQLKTLPGAEANVDVLLAGLATTLKGDSAKMDVKDDILFSLEKYFIRGISIKLGYLFFMTSIIHNEDLHKIPLWLNTRNGI